MKCLVEKREFEIEFPVEEKKRMNSKLNAFSIIYWVEEKKRMGSDAGKKRKRS